MANDKDILLKILNKSDDEIIIHPKSKKYPNIYVQIIMNKIQIKLVHVILKKIAMK